MHWDAIDLERGHVFGPIQSGEDAFHLQHEVGTCLSSLILFLVFLFLNLPPTDERH